jgi:hypothetical protein
VTLLKWIAPNVKEVPWLFNSLPNQLKILKTRSSPSYQINSNKG